MRYAPLGWFAALLLLVAGCADPDAPGTDPAPGAGNPPEVAAEFEERATHVVAAWNDSNAASAWHSGFLPLEPLTVVPTDPSHPDEVAQAASAGWFRTDLELATERPPEGEVTFENGDALPVPLVPVIEAWDAIHQGEPDCPDQPAPDPSSGDRDDADPNDPDPNDPDRDDADPDPDPDPDDSDSDGPVGSAVRCAVLTVTDAELGSVTVTTSRGPAEAPAWLFTVDELAEPVARIAVAPEAVEPVPEIEPVQFEHHPRLVNPMDLVDVDGEELAYRLGIGSCDTDPAPLVYETADAVVVGGSVTPPSGGQICTDDLQLAPVTVTLDAPMNGRPVLSALTGQPLTFGRYQ